MITVVGAGSWGTTFAVRMARRFEAGLTGQPVTLYEFFPRVAQDIQKRRENRLFLPGVRLPRSLVISNDLDACVRSADLVFNAVPTQFIRNVFQSSPLWRGKALVNLSKGIEIKTGQTISGVFFEMFPSLSRSQYAVLSGPSHAEEVILNIPTAAVVAVAASSVSPR